MKKEEKKLLLDCKNQFEWLSKVEGFDIYTSTKNIISRIEEELIKEEITNTFEHSIEYMAEIEKTQRLSIVALLYTSELYVHESLENIIRKAEEIIKTNSNYK